jgi:hypothetical protein
MLSASLFAQNSNLIIFSEDGDEFTMFLNGIKQNDTPAANIKASELNADSYKVRLEFNNKSIPTLNKNVWFETKGEEYTFAVKQKNNGKYTLRFVSQTAISQQAEPLITETVYETPEESPETEEYTYEAEEIDDTIEIEIIEEPEEEVEEVTFTINVQEDSDTEESESANLSLNIGENSVSMGVQDEDGENVHVTMDFNIDASNSTVETQHTSTSESSPDNENVSISFDIDEEDDGDVNLSMSISGGQTESYTTTSSSTTITTSTNGYTTTTTSTEENVEYNYEPEVAETNGNCPWPMSDSDFADAKSSIGSKDFEDSKLTLAKQVTKSNCLDSKQIKGIMNLFDFEDTKLEYAKFAYDYVYDVNNFYKVNDAFEFEMTIDELNEYIENK